MPTNLKIEIRLRSPSKAIRNDPRPERDPGYWLRFINEEAQSDASSMIAEESADGMSIASSSSEDDIFAEYKWMEQIDGVVISKGDNESNDTQVGYCDGKLIRRQSIRAIFRTAMEEPTEEMCSLAFDLLDRYGRLRPEFKDHPIKKGSGVWSTELDDGDIFLIESLEIDGQYRRLGQGSALVRAMMEKVNNKTLDFIAIVRPDDLHSALLSETCGGTLSNKEPSTGDISKYFWRSLGFRRIGSSSWFGLASDPEHSCHHLAAENDYDSPVLSQSTFEVELEREMRAVLEGGSDNDYMKFLSRVWDDIPSNDQRWTYTDKNGNTVLHLAATSLKPDSVQWVLSRAKLLLHQRNIQGETPLDSLLIRIEDDRTTLRFNELTVDISDQFAGFDDSAVACLILLTDSVEVTDIDRQCFKYGCTCGQCISGFLSPRMRFALECQADRWSDFLGEFIEDGSFWIENNSSALDFVPRQVLDNLETNKSMRNGFLNLCNHIATCLRRNMVPSQPNVETVLREASEWPSTSRVFLQRGGTVGAVASMLFRRAMESDELAGDPLHMETFAQEIQQLPECRNDHEFGFASGMCGYERVSAF